MKKSNFLLMILSVVLLLGVFVTDKLLAINYTKIDLNDRYKNFSDIAVHPFKVLSITGGNSYAVKIEQGLSYNIKVMNSRKSFLKTLMLSDTLVVTFSVANQQYQKPEDCSTGLIITVPSISLIKLSGINAELASFNQHALSIIQDGKTYTRLKSLNLDSLQLQGNGQSLFDCAQKNEVKYLGILLKDFAAIQMRQIKFQQCNPVVKDSAAFVLYGQSLRMFSQNNFIKDSF